VSERERLSETDTVSGRIHYMCITSPVMTVGDRDIEPVAASNPCSLFASPIK
jgi:hypothetical protein